jgi:hypothetical protein
VPHPRRALLRGRVGYRAKARPLPPISASLPTPQTLAVRAGQNKSSRLPSKTAQNPHVNPPPTPKPHKTRTTTADFSSTNLAYLPHPKD